jgi:hypothetical protein
MVGVEQMVLAVSVFTELYKPLCVVDGLLS